VVAVAISDRAIGIDIERTTRDFERAKSRYMSPSEANLSSAEHWAAYVWTAKEALYKLLGRRGVELRDDLRIESYDEATRVMLARLAEGIAARVEIVTYEDNIVVAVASYQEY
jgi:phosphopantetheinyl transferase